MSSETEKLSAVLVLGGTGTVGSRVAQQLLAQDKPVYVASRKGISSSGSSEGHEVVFNWQDRATWSKPFEIAAKKPDAGGGNKAAPIRSVYLIAPPVLDSASIMMEFVDFARDRGVRRVVLQSASSIEPGGPAMGKVHAYLRELGQRGEVEWAVIRPSWFQQNFARQANHVKSIKEEGKVYSATGDGKIPWVSADDIAAVAVRALTMPDPVNTEYMVLGPELLSYDDIAHTLSEVLGKKIVHVDLSSADLEKRHQSFGMPADYASMMSALDTGIKYGMENRTNDVVLSVTGVPPKRFREFAESNKEVWVSA
ncbi:hypothetical protein B0H66DRAFT_634881 [Apodospora peruviana]|uniref:NAD(P)-binding domain-containing protein n=1 Tax=Apodospora peruviana TaxID=516989 RepID=A0AAE0IR09_9PEZI|nr:hypothetical protein B0H66DRAFT_634881 [Apodospora peruviana]